jgi:hypothetical protein
MSSALTRSSPSTTTLASKTFAAHARWSTHESSDSPSEGRFPANRHPLPPAAARPPKGALGAGQMTHVGARRQARPRCTAPAFAISTSTPAR